MAGITIDIKKVFKKYDFKPEYDSDGGGNYVDGVDDLQAAKFNHRWNGENEILQDLQDNNEMLHSLIKTSRSIAYLHEDQLSSFVWDGYLPFEIQSVNDNLEFFIWGTPSVLLMPNDDKLILPTTAFYDFIRKGDEQFAVVVGNTNLFEIQNDYPTSGKKWYRLGHDGAEGSPAAVTVRHVLSTATEWGNGDVKFYDHMNNPSGGTQVIRFDSVGRNGEYVELIIDNDYPNYRYSAALWDGGALQTYINQDTGKARSIGEHRVYLYGYKAQTQLVVDGTNSMIKVGETIQYIDEIEFTSNNATGSADYFDILRFNVYFNVYLTAIVDNFNYIYIDKSDGYSIKRRLDNNVSDGVILYILNVPSGATGILPTYTADVRDLSKFIENNPIFPDLSVDGNLTVVDGVINIDDAKFIQFGTDGNVGKEYITAAADGTADRWTLYVNTNLSNGPYIDIKGPNYTTTPDEFEMSTKSTGKFIWGKYDHASHFAELNATGLVILGLGWTEIKVDSTNAASGGAQLTLNGKDDSIISFKEDDGTKVTLKYTASLNEFSITMGVETEAITMKFDANTYFTFSENGLLIAPLITMTMGVFADGNRPAAGTAGRVIFNTTDGNLNIDDGTNWILPDGTTT